ncbi:MAG: NUDIX hydrolase [Leptolyngbyaceae cyanobacterium]
MNYDKHWQRQSTQVVFSNPWLTVNQATIVLPNGTVIDDYFLVSLPDVALVMPVTPNQEVIMVRQYRHGADLVLLELPAGSFDPSQETAATAAQRELREETGYAASTLEPLGVIYDNPVKCPYQTHLFLARDVVPVATPTWDATEDIEIVKRPLREIQGAIAQREIIVSGSIVALHLGLEKLG